MNYYLYESNLKSKKFVIKFVNEKTKRINTIHFGAAGYDDYTLTNDDKQKLLYQKRHQNDYINDLNYAGCWSWWLLWNKKTLDASIRDMEKRFKITIMHQ